MSSDQKFRDRILHTLVLTAGVLSLTGCQVRPLYDNAGLTASHLASIEFSDAGSRVEQVVRNQLIFLTSGGAGEAEKADFSVALDVVSAQSKVLLIQSSDTARAAQVTVSGTYRLVRNSDQQILKSGKRSATSLVDLSIQEFANVRAVRDAENRAARELAELIRADIATALSR